MSGLVGKSIMEPMVSDRVKERFACVGARVGGSVVGPDPCPGVVLSGWRAVSRHSLGFYSIWRRRTKLVRGHLDWRQKLSGKCALAICLV